MATRRTETAALMQLTCRNKSTVSTRQRFELWGCRINKNIKQQENRLNLSGEQLAMVYGFGWNSEIALAAGIIIPGSIA